jgi:hypothetical protein
MPPKASLLNTRKFDYQEVLRDVARSMVRLKRPDRLLKLIARFIDRQFGLVHASLLVFDPKKSRYVFVHSKGAKRLPMGLVKFDSDHPLVQWFSGSKKKLSIQKDFPFRCQKDAFPRGIPDGHEF